jgi:hypothetical protein
MPVGQKVTEGKYPRNDGGLAVLGFIFVGNFRFGLDADVIGAERRKALDDFVAIFYFETRPAFVARLVAGIGQRQSVIALPTLRTFTFQHFGNIIQSVR